MSQAGYDFQKRSAIRYSFISTGKKDIEKVIEFSPLNIENIFNMGFGDLQPDGSLNDTVNSNNGDIVRVLATVVEILKFFTLEFPHVTVYFSGSNVERTRLYTRILKNYYDQFQKEFAITGLVLVDNNFEEINYQPANTIEYSGFLIKRFNFDYAHN